MKTLTAMAAALMSTTAFAAPITKPPKINVPFLSQPASGNLYFGPGQVATVHGKSFSSTSTTATAAILCDGCAGVDIQNSDFDVPNIPAIYIRDAVNPIPVVILHNRCKIPTKCITLDNVTAAPSSTITHNGFRGIAPNYRWFIAAINNSGGMPGSYCVTLGQNPANCVLKFWYNHGDGRDVATNALPVYPTGSVGMLIGAGATKPTTGYMTTIYNTLVYAGAINHRVAGGTANVQYYNKYVQALGASGAIASLVIDKDPLSVIGPGFVPPETDVCYFVQIDALGYVPAILDNGSMGNSTYTSNVSEDVFLSGDLNSTVAPE